MDNAKDTPLKLLQVKPEVAERFGKYCQEQECSPSEGLEQLLERKCSTSFNRIYFEQLESNITKRINFLGASLKHIEKNQTRPILAMLQLLFQETPGNRQELLIERNSGKAGDQNRQETLLWEKLEKYHNSLKHILDQVMVSRTSFGIIQLRLNLSYKEDQEYLSSVNSD